MASFAEAHQAVAAALAMRRAIAAFNAGKGDRGLVLKIGVHVGPAIAVTLNDRLDWFGQTVNIAARVQGLSGAGEVCVTQDVVDADGVTGLLAGLPITDRVEQLRGVTAGVRVHRIAAGPTG
jgi:class 3 adenylate cyclase